MHVDDIEAALDDRSFPRIEGAFSRLVQWSDSQSVRGVEDAHELGRLLDRVTAALEADHREMPADLVASILTRAGDGTWLRDDRTYAAGARTVAARAGAWRAMFASRFGVADRSPAVPGSPVTL